MRALLALMLLPGIALAQSETLAKCEATLRALDTVHVRVQEAQVIAAVKQQYIELCQAMLKVEEEKAKALEEEKKKEK